METSAHVNSSSDEPLNAASDGPGLNVIEVTMVTTGILTAAGSLLIFCLKYIPDFTGVHI